MNIFKATQDFEQWLAKRLPVVRQDVALKHALMAQAAFPFFRATFYRWLQHWHEACDDLAKAPLVLGVGDLHIENFGTWRDEEGRLIWGVNDLDEAFPAAYTLDLVRLTTSAYLVTSGCGFWPPASCATPSGFGKGCRRIRPTLRNRHKKLANSSRTPFPCQNGHMN